MLSRSSHKRTWTWINFLSHFVFFFPLAGPRRVEREKPIRITEMKLWDGPRRLPILGNTVLEHPNTNAPASLPVRSIHCNFWNPKAGRWLGLPLVLVPLVSCGLGPVRLVDVTETWRHSAACRGDRSLFCLIPTGLIHSLLRSVRFYISLR